MPMDAWVGRFGDELPKDSEVDHAHKCTAMLKIACRKGDVLEAK